MLIKTSTTSFFSKYRPLVLYLCLLIPACSFGQLSSQYEAEIDSIKLVIESATHDSIEFEALYHWDALIYIHDLDKSLDLMHIVNERCRGKIQETEISGNKESNEF